MRNAALCDLVLQLSETPEEIEGTFAVANFGGAADGFGDEVLGAADRIDGTVAQDQETEESGGKGAAGAVGGGGVDVFADKAVDLAGRKANDVGGLGVVAAGGNDI